MAQEIARLGLFLVDIQPAIGFGVIDQGLEQLFLYVFHRVILIAATTYLDSFCAGVHSCRRP